MGPFPHIMIEQTSYPTVIVGGDRFTGLFGKPRHAHLEHVITTPAYISHIFEACYKFGFRGFDVSMSEQVIRCFRQLKEKYPDCIGIGNPNWNCGIMLDTIPLRKAAPRIKAHLFTQVFSADEQAAIAQLSPEQQAGWFAYPAEAIPLTDHDIARITVDEQAYQANLDRLKSLCEFCLVGTVFADWLPLLDREDILRTLIQRIRASGMIPLSIHHWTSLVLPQLDTLDVAGHWTYLNKAWQFLAEQDALHAIRHASKPVTAFSVLRSRDPEALKAYFDYAFQVARVDAVDFGVETIEEAQRISTILHARYAGTERQTYME